MYEAFNEQRYIADPTRPRLSDTPRPFLHLLCACFRSVLAISIWAVSMLISPLSAVDGSAAMLGKFSLVRLIAEQLHRRYCKSFR